MVFPVVGGDGKPTGYDIDNSLRFDGDNDSLSREFSADPDTRKKFTISFWAKRGELGSDNAVFGARTTANFWSRLHFDSSDRIRLQNVASGSTDVEFEASVKLRDPSAWYHIVFAVDTTQSAIGDGVKLYINGTRITDTSSTNYSQNATFEFARNGTTNYIGRDDENSSFFDGYISEFYYVDNQQLAPTAFGETNDNGVWIPIDAKDDITFGANGFYLEFKQSGDSANSSGKGADTSGNDEHFTSNSMSGVVPVVDTPTNNFATMIRASNLTISEGNLNFTHNRTSNWDGTTASMGVQNGKWYYEAKLTSTDASPRHNIGFAGDAETWTVVVDGKGGSGDPTSSMTNAYWFHSNTNSVGYLNKTDTYGTSVSQWGIASGDIVGVALDMDNQKIYFHKNGTYYGADGNSSDPTNGTNPAYSSITTGIHYRPFLMLRNDGSETNTISMNFGNPVYSISSGNADANGYGNFEYAVPSGYYALCTKNLAEFG